MRVEVWMLNERIFSLILSVCSVIVIFQTLWEPRTQPYSVVLMKCFLKYSTTYKLWLLIRPSVCVWCISIHCFQFYTFSNEMMLFCVMETSCSPNCQSIQMSVCHCSVFIVAECAPVSTCAVSTHHQGGDISVEIETIDCGSRPCDCGIHRPIDPPRCVCV